MDPATGLGVVIGFGMLLTGYMFEEGTVPALIALSPVLIVFGGTLGAILCQFTFGEVAGIPRFLSEAMQKPNAGDAALRQLIETLVTLAEKARREGVLSLEADIMGELLDKKYDPELRKGLRFMVDGSEPSLIKRMLENEIITYEAKKRREASVFDAAGRCSVAMGVVGTVVGLIKILGSLSDPGQLATAVAMSLVAMLYGVSFAYLFWIPVGGKLKGKLSKELRRKALSVEGVMSIQAGENPTILRERLEVFLTENR
ncbi:MAG TPA: MotA/TolQ/ExbB proton channel family protein [Chitinivibrionales bacterium]|nr:MotA/TolQ/ExbB proton channel family protein [Chitinivibrionales bacterium]